MGRRCSEICSTKAVRGFALTVNVDAINLLSEVEQLHHMSWCREVPTKRTLMVLSHITKTWGLTSSGLSFDSCQPTARLNAQMHSTVWLSTVNANDSNFPIFSKLESVCPAMGDPTQNHSPRKPCKTRQWMKIGAG